MKNLSFKRHLTPYVIDGEAVYLVSESGVTALQGPLAADLAGLLDGTRSVEELALELADRFPPERVLHALDMLGRAGHLTSAVPQRESGYWHYLGVDDPVLTGGARFETHGRTDSSTVVAACRAAGVPAEPDGLVVALTDDYLQPSLADRNRAALDSGEPWLLARSVGAVLWVGPFFRPGETGCWECLSHRLTANRQTQIYLQRRLGRDEPLHSTRADAGVVRQLTAQLIAAEVAKCVAGAAPPLPSVFTLDMATLTAQHHELTRRPQCPACGDPGLIAAQTWRPVEFRATHKAYTSDGGHRAKAPDDLLDQFAKTVSPITGVVPSLLRVEDGPGVMKTYIAGSNMARRATDLRSLQAGLRSMSCGKGMTDTQARASAIGEGIERYSGVYQGDEPRLLRSYEEVVDTAIHPADCLLFSDEQYQAREEWNARGSAFANVADPLPPEVRIDWSPVFSLTQQRHRLLPTSYLYYATPRRGLPNYAPADSNGSAAGASLEDAALQGFLELVEREGVGIWWYNRLQRPAVDLDAFGDSYLDRYRQDYAALGREVWALDLTADFGIPVVAALSRRVDKPVEDILVAFGAHLDPRIALTRALTEMNQFLPAVINVDREGRGYGGADRDQRRWWASATIANSPYLLPDPTLAPSTPASWSVPTGSDLLDDLQLIQQLVQDQGLELLVLDQTRPDIGLPVAKVIVPGMRHFWARFAPGRLYDLPVRLGWRPSPLAEAELNPVPMFI